ncbi:MAG: radical SAM protein [bacterium]
MWEHNGSVKYTNLIKCRSILNKSGIPGIDYAINPYVGCTHKCQYCYAVFMKRFSGHTEPWGDFVDIKTNAPAVLERQLTRLKRRSHINFGTVCDAYQPIERKYKITRKCLSKLIPYHHSVSILTKSPLVTRDIDLLKQIDDVEVGFTITTLDPMVRRVFEPGTSPPSQRFQAIEMLNRHGIRTWVFVAPVLPYFTDSQQSITQIIRKTRDAGARHIMFDTLNPYPKVWKNVKRLVKKYFPEAIEQFRDFQDDSDHYRNRLRRKITDIGFKNILPCKFAFGCG